MDRKWLYPYYLIVILALVLFFFGCDTQGSESFSVTVQVETEKGTPIEGATVGVRPCYNVGQDVWCVGPNSRSTQATRERKAVELVDWDVRVDGADAILTWTTASETDNAGFEIEAKSEEEDFFELLGFVEGQGTTDDSTSYRYRAEDLNLFDGYTFRLIAVATDGTSRVVGEPKTVRRLAEPGIEPIFPNPLWERAIFEVWVGKPSVIRSTAHTLDGEKYQTIVLDTVRRENEVRLYQWNAEDLPAGLYEHRTRIRTNGTVVFQDTTYAIIAGKAPVGTTDAEGTTSTAARVRFPALYNVPDIGVRDRDGRIRDTMSVSPTVEFIVTTDDGRHTYRRTVSEGENTLTLTVSP